MLSGSTGYVMKNSGTLELLWSVSAKKWTKKTSEGNQYERPVRAHNLVSNLLNKLLLQQIYLNNKAQMLPPNKAKT